MSPTAQKATRVFFRVFIWGMLSGISYGIVQGPWVWADSALPFTFLMVCATHYVFLFFTLVNAVLLALLELRLFDEE